MLTQRSHALKFGNQKINLHLSGKEFEPKAGRVQPGSGDLCFITDHPITDVLSRWKTAGIEVRPNLDDYAVNIADLTIS